MVFDTIASVYTAATWPLDAVGQIQAKRTSVALIGVAGGGGIAYLLWGDPMKIVSSGDPISIALFYGTVGVGYVLLGNSIAAAVVNNQ